MLIGYSIIKPAIFLFAIEKKKMLTEEGKKMNRAPAWTQEEFEVLLKNSSMSDDELAKKLPKRSLGSIGTVRSGIHSYHRNLDVSMLSKMMLDKLSKVKGTTICPKCGVKF